MSIPGADTRRSRRRSRRGRLVLANVVGVLGEVLVSVGALLGLFVVWQLWWTDVVAARAQAHVVEALAWPPPPPALIDAAHSL